MLLIAGGDVAYPRGWMDRLVERQGSKMFDFVRGYAEAADLAFLNLESPYTDAEFTLKKKWPIATPPHRLDYVLDGGFNMFSLANNHMGDAGKQGVFDTLDLLAKKNSKRRPLFWAGAARTAKKAYEPTIFKVPGKRLTIVFHAFGYARTKLVPALGKRALEAVRAYRSKGDITIVSVHHGKEYKHLPSRGKAGSFRKYIDAGADIVLGHHPHVVQGVEAYKKGLIFHSLGNFSFASKTKRHHKTGARLYSILPLIYIKNGKVERAEILPLYVNNGEPMKVGNKRLRHTNFKPQILKGVFADKMLGELRQWTHDLPGIHERAVKAFSIKGERAWIQVAR
jgi:poly-gamma-glutamate capsule biosynthesis protein CapA/YwtB (metallophosphatase superfamily)